MAALATAILAYLRGRPAGADDGELAAALGAPLAEIERACATLRDAGRLARRWDARRTGHVNRAHLDATGLLVPLAAVDHLRALRAADAAAEPFSQALAAALRARGDELASSDLEALLSAARRRALLGADPAALPRAPLRHPDDGDEADIARSSRGDDARPAAVEAVEEPVAPVASRPERRRRRPEGRVDRPAGIPSPRAARDAGAAAGSRPRAAAAAADVAAPPAMPGDLGAAAAVEPGVAAPARVAAPSAARSAASPARRGPPRAAGERAARVERARVEGALAAARAAWGREQAEEAARHYGLALELIGPSGAVGPVLAAEDYLAIALLADYECLALPEERVLDAYEHFAERAGRDDLRRLPDAPAVLHRRLALARRLTTGARLARAYADLLDYAIVEGDFVDLPRLFPQLREDRERQLLTAERHFYLLDVLYPSAVSLPELKGALGDEYAEIVNAEAAVSLRSRGQLPAYVDDVLNALLFLRREGNHALRAYIREQRAALADGGQPLPEQEIEQEARPDLARLRLALVGGHSRARSAVIEELRRNYGLRQPVEEVPPSSEGAVNRRIVQERLATSTLAAVIPGYMGHDLSEIVRRLEAGPLRGRVRWLTTRGKSGVVRELLAISRARA